MKCYAGYESGVFRSAGLMRHTTTGFVGINTHIDEIERTVLLKHEGSWLMHDAPDIQCSGHQVHVGHVSKLLVRGQHDVRSPYSLCGRSQRSTSIRELAMIGRRKPKYTTKAAVGCVEVVLSHPSLLVTAPMSY